MFKRLEPLTNLGLLFTCVLVSGFLIRDRVLPRLFADSAAATTPAPPANPAAGAPAGAPQVAELRTAADVVSGLGPPVSPLPATALGSATAAVVFADAAITTEQLETLAAGQLQSIRSQEYMVKRTALDRTVDRVLLEREAARRGTSLEAFVRQEVTDAIAPPTEKEIDEAAAANPGRFPNLTSQQVRAMATLELTHNRQMAKLRTLTQGLRAKAGVLVLLDAPRVDVDPGPGPVRGASDAPVTIVEFSDFQCPFCARTQATLTQLEEQYAGKVRLVFRHFPLPIHKDAPAAAEASECAREQNRFWEMHDAMFAIANITAADIPRAAERVKLDMTHFDSCVQSGRHRQAWERDKAAGERHGVASTPTFFVNGRMVVGAQPIETFAAVVNEELDRHRTQNR